VQLSTTSRMSPRSFYRGEMRAAGGRSTIRELNSVAMLRVWIMSAEDDTVEFSFAATERR
jgi:hypothetical protein